MPGKAGRTDPCLAHTAQQGCTASVGRGERSTAARGSGCRRHQAVAARDRSGEPVAAFGAARPSTPPAAGACLSYGCREADAPHTVAPPRQRQFRRTRPVRPVLQRRAARTERPPRNLACVTNAAISIIRCRSGFRRVSESARRSVAGQKGPARPRGARSVCRGLRPSRRRRPGCLPGSLGAVPCDCTGLGSTHPP